LGSLGLVASYTAWDKPEGDRAVGGISKVSYLVGAAPMRDRFTKGRDRDASWHRRRGNPACVDTVTVAVRPYGHVDAISDARDSLRPFPSCGQNVQQSEGRLVVPSSLARTCICERCMSPFGKSKGSPRVDYSLSQYGSGAALGSAISVPSGLAGWPNNRQLARQRHISSVQFRRSLWRHYPGRCGH